LISWATVLGVTGVAGSTAVGAAPATTTTVNTTIGYSTSMTSTSSTTTTVATPLKVPKSGKFTILEIGDSLGTDLGGGLAHQLEKSPKIRLILEGKSSTGLSNSGFYNWPQHLKTFLAQYHPQLTILLLGGNDEQGTLVNGRAAAFDTPPWRKQYAKNVAAMMDDAINAGSAVLWIGLPIMYPNGYRQGMQVINSIFAKVAKTKQRVTFLPTWKFFANSKGQFRFNAMVDGVQQAIRTSDGIHPTAVGQNVLATYVVQELRILYGLPATPAFPEIFTSKTAR
jgi:hypothetical protein